MTRDLYKYTFEPEASLDDIEVDLVLAIISTESIHGESVARLDVSHALDRDKRACIVDAGTPAGSDFNKLFVGYLRRDQGENSFRVERLGNAPARQPAAAAA